MLRRLGPVCLRLEKRLDGAEMFVAIAGLCAMVGLALIQSLSRNLLDSGLPAVDVALRHLVVLVSFAGAVIAIRDGRHIRIDLALIWISPAWHRVIGAGCSLFSAAVCAAFAWAAMRFWLEELRMTPEHGRWLALAGVLYPLAFGLMAFHFLVRWVTRCTDFNPARR